MRWMAWRVVAVCVVMYTQANAWDIAQDCGQRICNNKRTKEGRHLLSNATDEYDYTTDVVLRLGWSQVVLLSNNQNKIEAVAARLGEVKIQLQVLHCNSSSDVQVDVALLHVLTSLKSPNVVIVGTRCLQWRILTWLNTLADEIGHMSPLVQDSHWLLAVDSHVMETVNVTSLLVNHVAFLIYHIEDRQVSLRTLTWTTTGRHLTVAKGSSLSRLEPALLYPNARYGLNGMVLRVAINQWTPYIMPRQQDGYTVYYGYSMDLLEIFSENMNFSYRLIMPADGEWGDYRDGKWTGVVGQIDRGEVDFSVAPLTPLYTRSFVVDWPGPFAIRYTGLAVRKADDTDFLRLALLRPFSGQVYLGVALAFITCTCAFSILLNIEIRLQQQWQVKTPSIFHIVEFLFGSFLKEIVQSDLMVDKGLRRPLVACWCVFSLLVTSAYMSKLTSLLVSASPPPPFTSMQEMVESGDFRWGVVGGTALLASFRTSNNSVLQAAYQGIMTFVEEDPDVLSLDAEVHRAKVAAGGYVYIGEEGLLDLWAAEDCHIQVIREGIIGMETYNVFTPKNSVLTQRIDQVLLKLKAGGIIDQLKKEWWPVENNCAADASSQTAISLDVMQGVFFAAGGGLCFAVLALLLERVAARRDRFAMWFPTWVSQKCPQV